MVCLFEFAKGFWKRGFGGYGVDCVVAELEDEGVGIVGVGRGFAVEEHDAFDCLQGGGVRGDGGEEGLEDCCC